MAEGIKIRALDKATTVDTTDVIIIDSVNPADSGLSYTKHIEYSDLIIALEKDLNITTEPTEPVDNFMLLQGETVVLKVTVEDKSAFSRYYNQGHAKCYFLDGQEAPLLLLTPGRRYRFDLTDVPSGYRFRLSSSITGFYGTISTNVTEGDGFLEYMAGPEYTRLYYSDRSQEYMGNAMVNLDGAQEWNPEGFEAVNERIDNIDTKLDTVQVDTNSLQSTQISNNSTLLNHTEDIGSNNVDINQLKNDVANLSNVVSQLTNAMSELGLVIETE